MNENWISLSVLGVFQHEDKNKPANQFFILRSEDKRRVPVFVGQCEAWAVALGLESGVSDPPMTHDVMLALIAALGADIQEVRITDLQNETFFAVLYLRIGDQTKEFEMRPSDVIAIAVRCKCPVYMKTSLFDELAQPL